MEKLQFFATFCFAVGMTYVSYALVIEMREFFVSPLTMMHLCIIRCTYWTPLVYY